MAASNNSSGYLRKPAHTISLRAMQQQIRQSNTSGQTATAASATQPSTSTSKLQKLKNEFDAERLTYYWFRYAQQLPKEKNHLMGRMKTMTLHLDTTTWTVQVEVENEMVEQYMRQEQISLMTYLRTQLRNDYITLQFNIKSSTAPHRAFSRVERFKELLNDYPDLEFMRKELNLELA